MSLNSLLDTHLGILKLNMILGGGGGGGGCCPPGYMQPACCPPPVGPGCFLPPFFGLGGLGLGCPPPSYACPTDCKVTDLKLAKTVFDNFITDISDNSGTVDETKFKSNINAWLGFTTLSSDQRVKFTNAMGDGKKVDLFKAWFDPGQNDPVDAATKVPIFPSSGPPSQCRDLRLRLAEWLVDKRGISRV